MQTPATSKLGRAYGYRPPHEGHPVVQRAQALRFSPSKLPDSVDLRPELRPVRDQGQEGSCFAHAAAALKEHNCVRWEKARGGPATPLGDYLSVAYLSWRTRLAMGTFPADSGASIADVMGVLQGWGACPESFLPYNANPSEAGNAQCDVAAAPYRVAQPLTVDVDATAWRQVLEAGHSICIGFSVHESFEETGPDGVVPPVQPGEGLLGGHAVLVCGFDARGFVVRNSWGAGWGDGGYCYFRDDYLSNVWECWTSA